MTREKDADTEKWDKLVSTMQVALWDRYIAEAMAWKMMVLIPKGGGGYSGIGLVEVIWKVRMSIVNSRLRSTIVLHDALHGFQQGRGAGTVVMEGKTEQKLVGIVHKPLLQVLIGVWKAYDSLYRGRYMDILRGYGLGPKLQRLLQRYWNRQKVVPKSGKFYGHPFSTEIGVT